MTTSHGQSLMLLKNQTCLTYEEDGNIPLKHSFINWTKEFSGKRKETDCWHSEKPHLKSQVDPWTLICICSKLSHCIHEKLSKENNVLGTKKGDANIRSEPLGQRLLHGKNQQRKRRL